MPSLYPHNSGLQATVKRREYSFEQECRDRRISGTLSTIKNTSEHENEYLSGTQTKNETRVEKISKCCKTVDYQYPQGLKVYGTEGLAQFSLLYME